MKMNKGMAAASGIVLMGALLSACGGNNNNAGSSASAPAPSASGSQASASADAGKPVKLTFSIWGNDSHKKMYEDMIAEYKKIKPNVDVEIMTIPGGDYQQKISVMLASKTAPDIMWMLERSIPQFINSGQIEDISSLKTDTDYDFADFIPSTLELVTQGDKLYGIPFSTPPNMIYYNKTLFAEKGLKTPAELYQEGNWTYDEMVKAATAITDSSKGVYGMNLINGSAWAESWMESLITVMWAYGADYFSEDKKSFAGNTPQGQQALQFFSDAMFKSQIQTKPGDQTGFETGKIGMQQGLLSYISKLKDVKDFEWDIAPMPKGPGGTPGTTLGYAAYMITKDSPNKAEALDFLKFLSSKENMAITSQYFVPGRKSVLESDGFLKQGPSPESVKTAILDQMAGAKVRPGFNNYQLINDKMKEDFDLIYTQSDAIPNILQKMEKDLNPILAAQ